MRHRNSFIADQRGAVAFEMPIVCLFMMMSLLLPLADLLSLASSLYPRGRHCVTSGNISSTTRHLTSPTRQVGRQAKLAKADPRLSHQQSFKLVCGDTNACLLSQQHCFAQVLFIHDDRHLVADGVKTVFVY